MPEASHNDTEEKCLGKKRCSWSSLVAQWVKDLVLLLLQHGFHPWPEYVCMLRAWPKKKKEGGSVQFSKEPQVKDIH